MRLGHRVEWAVYRHAAEAYVFLVAFLDLQVCLNVAWNGPMSCEQY